jgi:YD repeat-containing protein
MGWMDQAASRTTPQGRERSTRKTRAGNVIETTYDANGRQTARKVTTVGSGFDNAILRIATTYDTLGRTSEIVQYDAAAPKCQGRDQVHLRRLGRHRELRGGPRTRR